MGEALRPHEDRHFDPDPTIRRIARELYAETRQLPIVSPHGHVDPKVLAENRPFEEPAALIVLSDHYILRMLYSRGIPLEKLGIVTRDGSWYEENPRAIWQLFAANYYLFRGTPTGAWIDHELHDVFGIRQRLTADSAEPIYDEITEKLAGPDYLPRSLYARFNIGVLATTDAALDSLEHHQIIRDSGWSARVIPTFRPDTLFQISRATWPGELAGLEGVTGSGIDDLQSFIEAIEKRRSFFRTMGGTATDHGVEQPFTSRLGADEAEELFQRARAGTAGLPEEKLFEAHMLVEMARLSTDDGMVMQLHAGSSRDHNREVFRRFGANAGGDIPIATEYTRNLQPLLNEYGNDPRLRLILFTLDESTYSRELAPLAGHYPAVLLGPPWWFHDSAEGMKRYRERVTETAGIYNTAGFNDDTRGFCSIPARHDLSRRVDANWLAGLVARHLIGNDEAREMARALAGELARQAYRLDEGSATRDAVPPAEPTGEPARLGDPANRGREESSTMPR